MGWGMRKELKDSLENHICLTTEMKLKGEQEVSLDPSLRNLGRKGQSGEEKQGRKRRGHWSRNGGINRLMYS